MHSKQPHPDVPIHPKQDALSGAAPESDPEVGSMGPSQRLEDVADEISNLLRAGVELPKPLARDVNTLAKTIAQHFNTDAWPGLNLIEDRRLNRFLSDEHLGSIQLDQILAEIGGRSGQHLREAVHILQDRVTTGMRAFDAVDAPVRPLGPPIRAIGPYRD